MVRLLFVFRPPELSDDLFRYIFDGLRLLNGHNPYGMSPLAAGLADPAATAAAAKVNHPDLVTIYPPAAQLVFWLGSALSPAPWGIKLVLAVLDLGTCAMIAGLLRHLRLPVRNTILYAWHPLVVLESAGSGHIDTAGIFFFFASLTLAVFFFSHIPWPAVPSSSGPGDRKMRRWVLAASGCLFALAALTKLFPIVFALFYIKWLHPQHRQTFITAAGLTGLLLCGAFLPDLGHMADTLFRYSRHWEFSGLLFRWAKGIGLSGDAARILLGGLFLTLAGVIYFRPQALFAPGKPAVPLNGLMLFLFQVYAISLAFMACSPTLYPWYALYMVALLPFFPRVTGLILSWAVLLSYQVLIGLAATGHWQETSLPPVLIWSGFGAGFLLHRWQTRDQSYRNK